MNNHNQTYCRKCKTKTDDERRIICRKGRRTWLKSKCVFCNSTKGRWITRNKRAPTPKASPESTASSHEEHPTTDTQLEPEIPGTAEEIVNANLD